MDKDPLEGHGGKVNPTTLSEIIYQLIPEATQVSPVIVNADNPKTTLNPHCLAVCKAQPGSTILVGQETYLRMVWYPDGHTTLLARAPRRNFFSRPVTPDVWESITDSPRGKPIIVDVDSSGQVHLISAGSKRTPGTTVLAFTNPGEAIIFQKPQARKPILVEIRNQLRVNKGISSVPSPEHPNEEQDIAWVSTSNPDLLALLGIDGIGGHAQPALAASIVYGTIGKFLYNLTRSPRDTLANIAHALEQSFILATSNIHALHIEGRPGAAASAAIRIVEGGHPYLIYAIAGNVRLFMVNRTPTGIGLVEVGRPDNVLSDLIKNAEQLQEVQAKIDHATDIQTLFDDTRVVFWNMRRHVITNHVGNVEGRGPTVGTILLNPHNIGVITLTDGAFESVRLPDIENIIQQGIGNQRSMQQICEEITSTAINAAKDPTNRRFPNRDPDNIRIDDTTAAGWLIF